MPKDKTCRIGIFCPSTPIDKDSKRYDYLKSRGFKIFETSQSTKKEGHTAGTIKERIDAIHSLFKNPNIDVLMSYWGGANTNQLLPYIDYELIMKNSKPIIGFSDTSALLLAINKFSKIDTFMGPAGISFDKPDFFEYTFDYFRRVVVDHKSSIEIKDSDNFADDLYFLRKDSNHRVIKKNPGRKTFIEGKAEGKVIASNLQTLLVLAGTKYFPNLEDKILFIEEAESEDTSMIHRFLTHLTQVIDPNKLAAICIGRFPSQCGFNKNDSEEKIYKDVFKNTKIPVVYNLDFGHTDPLFTIPIGWNCSINTKEKSIKFYKEN